MKKILISFFVIASLLSWAGLVFWNFINFEKNINFEYIDSKNIFPDSKKLNSVTLWFSSNINLESAFISSHCNSKTQFLYSKSHIYYFKFTLLDDSCENPNFVLQKWDERFAHSSFLLNIQKKSHLFSTIIDYPSNKISSAQEILNKKIKKIPSQSREYDEISYKKDILTHILNRRESKYSVPVQGYKIATGLNVIPNAARNYRKGYTDGIHHWWDIMAPLWTPVSAIDDGIIIRVVNNFSYEDIANIQKWEDLTLSQKLRNLDILRWNQVWLKTTKWDVIFYSHLTKIYEWIEEWTLVSVGTQIGTIGKTWVPDKNYTNYHLHFPIQKNPYDLTKVWKYSLEDYMWWSWYLKDLDATSVINGQNDIFVDEVE